MKYLILIYEQNNVNFNIKIEPKTPINQLIRH